MRNIHLPMEVTEAFAPDPLTGELAEDWMPSVLIVDDDPEATILVDWIFRNYGCFTDVAFTAAEASERVAQDWYDLIILDWALDKGTGGELVNALLKEQSLFDKFRRLVIRGPQRIITYTATDLKDLQIPESKYFIHVDHWSKPMRSSDVYAKAERIFSELKS